MIAGMAADHERQPAAQGPIQRRTALKLMAAGVLAERIDVATGQLVALSQAPAGYELQFFNSEQDRLLDRLSEIIIPEDDHSPGAHAAKVSHYIDVMVANSSARNQESWVADLQAVEEDAQRRFQKSFLDCDAVQQDAVMASMAEGEEDPQTPLKKFFVRLKAMTIEGYYTSRIGIHQDLRYQGNTALDEFPGCTHPEHQA
jgi:hypothetical protein